MQKEPKVVKKRTTSELLQDSVAKSIDTRGMACPYPSFEAVKSMNSINAKEVLEVITDSDESALDSIPSVCDKRGWEYVVVEDEKNLWRVRIKK
ncbi:MAG: sulfurtransferase TusA family protein [Nitrososphaerales archaeon]